MERRTYLQIPGPTNIPDRILKKPIATPNKSQRSGI